LVKIAGEPPGARSLLTALLFLLASNPIAVAVKAMRVRRQNLEIPGGDVWAIQIRWAGRNADAWISRTTVLLDRWGWLGQLAVGIPVKTKTRAASAAVLFITPSHLG
jgi:hypothetical protein